MKIRELKELINEVQREPVQPAEVEFLKLVTKALNTKRPWLYKLRILTEQARVKFRVVVYKNGYLLDLSRAPSLKPYKNKWLNRSIPDQKVLRFAERVDVSLQQEIEKHVKGQVKSEVRGAELFLERMRRSFRSRIEAEMGPDLFYQPNELGGFLEETSIEEKLEKVIPPEILEIQERLKKLGYTF